MDHREIVLLVDGEGQPLTFDLHARPSTVADGRVKCLLVAKADEDTRIRLADGKVSPKLGREGFVVPDPREFRVETTA